MYQCLLLAEGGKQEGKRERERGRQIEGIEREKEKEEEECLFQSRMGAYSGPFGETADIGLVRG